METQALLFFCAKFTSALMREGEQLIRIVEVVLNVSLGLAYILLSKFLYKG